MYINSDKPKGRKRSDIAILLAPQDALFLSKMCYLDTTEFPDISAHVVRTALSDANHCLGPFPPTLRQAVVSTVRNYGVLEPAQRQAVLAGEP